MKYAALTQQLAMQVCVPEHVTFCCIVFAVKRTWLVTFVVVCSKGTRYPTSANLVQECYDSGVRKFIVEFSKKSSSELERLSEEMEVHSLETNNMIKAGQQLITPPPKPTNPKPNKDKQDGESGKEQLGSFKKPNDE